MKSLNMRFKNFMKEYLLVEEIDDLRTIKIILRNCFVAILTCITVVIGLDLIEVAFNTTINIDPIFFQVPIFIFAIKGFFYCRKL